MSRLRLLLARKSLWWHQLRAKLIPDCHIVSSRSCVHFGFGSFAVLGLGVVSLRCYCDDKHAEVLPSPPRHHILRHNSDPRIDPALLVRYDPPPGVSRTGAAVVICPGGNYESLANHEAQPVAVWLAGLGIAAFVLRYRLISEGHYWPSQLQDLELSMGEIRKHAEDWKIDTSKIGVIGFSAGGHLASYGATRSALPWRPNAQILVYPCIDTTKPDSWPWKAHEGFPRAADSSHLGISPETPTAFLVCSTEDGVCDAHENTDVFATRLQAAGVPFEYVKKPMGKHGHSLQGGWLPQCTAWLQNLGWANPA